MTGGNGPGSRPTKTGRRPDSAFFPAVLLAALALFSGFWPGGAGLAARPAPDRQSFPQEYPRGEAPADPKGAGGPPPEKGAGAPVVPVTVEHVAGRPQNHFTQGLLFYGNRLYESTGLYGQSALHVFPASELEQPGGLGTEVVLGLPEEVFAEGIAEADGVVYILTWREGVILAVDPRAGLRVARTVFQPGEGWGLAYDGSFFWRSDGSDRLQKIDPGTLAPTGPPLLVRDGDKPVRQLNELEWDPRSRLLLANIWHSDLVAAISLDDGRVRFYLDLGSFAKEERDALGAEATANGLALDDRGRLWATGKLWPRVYRVSYEAPGGSQR
ncbi:MAG: glutaminyl-peptide cyclotransferase [Deltaproteobacteria bacterium]|jgi:glutaminyl-peptide cyclotransferase|nr:glutaminyl-peptide cyclotransferase [Deltaproteobacteria bacterium]